LLESGLLLTASEAERRVLVLENPALAGQTRATATLYAGIQLILPGEVAAPHRHTASALRFFLEGEGAFTTVGCERTTMRPGDFVITPSWEFHGHGSDGSEPCAWLDGLDLPMVAFFEAGFSEHPEGAIQAPFAPEGHSLAQFGQGLLPISSRRPFGPTSPVFNYPYERTLEALLSVSRGEPPDPYHGTALRYSNPLDGGWAMPTMSSWIFHLPRGFETSPIRSTDGIVLAVSEGRGRATVAGMEMDFEEKDVIAIPSWSWRSFSANEDCIIFAFSDRAAQEKLGLFREQKGNGVDDS
jgi:gentisate 1,2-dioxygenase